MGLTSIEAWWIPILAGVRVQFLDVTLSFVRVCVLFKKTRLRMLPEDGIRFSLVSLVPVVHLAPSVCVCRCVSGGSIFGGAARICSSFVYVHVSSG